MTPDPPASQQYTLIFSPVRGVSFAASDNKSTLLQEVEKRHEQGVYITKKRCAELDGAARLRLNFCD